MFQYLITEFGFTEVRKGRENEEDQMDFDQYSCVLRIHELIYLFFSEHYKHFSIVKKHERPKGLPAGFKEHEVAIMIPVVIKTKEDVDNMMLAFKIEKTK